MAQLSGIAGTPLVYWWDKAFLDEYVRAPKLHEQAHVCKGLITGDDTRFNRLWWEPEGFSPRRVGSQSTFEGLEPKARWAPAIKGAKGRAWFEPLVESVNWRWSGLELKVLHQWLHGSFTKRVQSLSYYFVPGVAFSMIGDHFTARVHRYHSVFGNQGSSAFPMSTSLAELVCAMNSSDARRLLQGLNPGIGFEAGDVERIAVRANKHAVDVLNQMEAAFSELESQRESSVEFKSPGLSAWPYAQLWAQKAVDMPDINPLPSYEPEYAVPAHEAYLSFGIGIAVGRFGVNGEGILTEAPATALPAGILYLSGSEALPDSLSHSASARIATAWTEHGAAILDGDRRDLRDWLREKFFAYHKTLYENRPIYFPLSSAKKSFVAFISIHRWTDTTLQTLLADHLHPNLRQLDALIADLNQARASSDRKAASGADRQYTQIKKLRDELADFIEQVTECAERGAPPAPGGLARAVDAPFHMDLDDGVMINSAALWPLLEPQWKDPKKWWKELCEAKGRKDYDWAHLAARYFPDRVTEKCRVDPSLAVAHGCFWRYHPAKAYAWELRLAHEIGPDFSIDEKDAAEQRARFLSEHREEADQILQKERDRRERLRRREADADAEPGRPGLARTTGNEPPDNDVVEDEDLDDEQVAV